MAEQSYFFDAVLVDGVYDRAYSAKDLAKYMADVLGNGVLFNTSSALQVFASSGMRVQLSMGTAFIKGQRYHNDNTLNLTIPTASGSLDRIDRIVIRLDYPNRKISAIVLSGTPSSNPQAPSLVRTEDVYDICVAEIRVSRGATSITQAQISDTRLQSSLCGVVTGVIEQIDATTLYVQLAQQFNAWFATIQGQLSSDAAGNLQNQVNGLKSMVGYEGVTSGTAPNYSLTLQDFLLADGAQVRVKIHQGTTSAATLNINGLGAKQIVDGYGEAVQNLASGAWLLLVYDGVHFQTIGLSTQYARYA